MDILTEKHSHVSNAANLIFSYEWTINNFPMCQEKRGEYIKSPIFSFSNCDYSIDLYPFGKNETTDHLSIFLNIEKKSHDFNEELLFYFSVLNNENEIACTERAKKRNSPDSYGRYGILEFIERDELLDPSNDILDNHALIMVCEFYTKNSAMGKVADENTIEFQKYKNKCNLYSNLQALLNNRKQTDVTLVVNEKEFSAHKLILTARSPVFAAMLENDMKEKINSKIDIEDVEVDVLEKMLEFMYTDKVINMNDFYPKLLYVADKYDIEGLKIACEEYAFNNLNVDNAVKVLTLCERYECKVLKPKVLQFIIKNAKKMIDHEQFDVWAKHLPLSLVDVIKAMA